MTRRTSIESYNKIKADGLLSHLQFAIYDKLFSLGATTQGELWNDHFQHLQRHSVAPRFAELKALGVIVEVGERPCRVTGVNALTWDVTEHLPRKLESKSPTESPWSSLQSRVEALEAKVARMEDGRFDANGQGAFALRNH